MKSFIRHMDKGNLNASFIAKKATTPKRRKRTQIYQVVEADVICKCK